MSFFEGTLDKKTKQKRAYNDRSRTKLWLLLHPQWINKNVRFKSTWPTESLATKTKRHPSVGYVHGVQIWKQSNAFACCFCSKAPRTLPKNGCFKTNRSWQKLVNFVSPPNPPSVQYGIAQTMEQKKTKQFHRLCTWSTLNSFANQCRSLA